MDFKKVLASVLMAGGAIAAPMNTKKRIQKTPQKWLILRKKKPLN